MKRAQLLWHNGRHHGLMSTLVEETLQGGSRFANQAKQGTLRKRDRQRVEKIFVRMSEMVCQTFRFVWYLSQLHSSIYQQQKRRMACSFILWLTVCAPNHLLRSLKCSLCRSIITWWKPPAVAALSSVSELGLFNSLWTFKYNDGLKCWAFFFVLFSHLSVVSRFWV